MAFMLTSTETMQIHFTDIVAIEDAESRRFKSLQLESGNLIFTRADRVATGMSAALRPPDDMI